MQVRFFIVKSKSKYTSIYVRFWDSKRVDQKSKTGLSVHIDSWNQRTQRVKNVAREESKDSTNKALRELEGFIHDKYNTAIINAEYVDKDWLKNTINLFFNKIQEGEEYKIFFLEYVRQFIEKAQTKYVNGKPLAKSTIKRYASNYRILLDYEGFIGRRLKHKDIDLNFYHSFIGYCTEEQSYSAGTISKIISHIKLWCKEIELAEIPISPHYKHRDFKRPSGDNIAIYLKDNEIKKIVEHDFSHSERLENARDLFVIGLRTGLRVSDLMQIKDVDLDKKQISITTRKTNTRVVIPLHSDVIQVLEKRKGELPKTISDQKFNSYIKEVSKEAGLTEVKFGDKRDETNRKMRGYFPMYELVTSHTCRRSFATNLYGTGLDNLTIMSITGHTSEKQFLDYVKTSKEEHAEKLRQHWEQEKKG